MKKTFIILIALVLVGGGLTAWYLYQKPVESLRDAETIGDFSSQEIYQAFSTDLVSAREKYVGKVIGIQGTVIDQLQNTDESTTLILEGGHPVFGVKCRLDPKEAGENIPRKGETVRLKGMCIGMNSDVEMNRCIIL